MGASPLLMINFPYGIKLLQLWGVHLPFCIGCYNSLRGSKFSLVDANLYFDIDDLNVFDLSYPTARTARVGEYSLRLSGKRGT